MNEDFLEQFSHLFDEPEPLSQTPYFIGMMSGTSLDGMDAVICQFFDDKPVEIIAKHSLPFTAELRQTLLALTQPNGVQALSSKHEFQSELDVFGWASVQYGEFAAEVVLQLLDKANICADEVCAIGCHGQTVRHRPQWAFSLQLLDPNVLAQRTQIAVVSDFRRRDMAVGGQGAPLVPAFHQAAFGVYPEVKAVLNLGGIANITVFNQAGDVLGFDTGVANLLMDAWIAQHSLHSYDKDGQWASQGCVIEPLLTLLLEHPFFKKSPPKSTGREDFHLTWLYENIHQLEQQNPNFRYSPADVQATLAEFTALSAAREIARFVDDGVVLVCGGGALNTYLCQRLQANLPKTVIQLTNKYGVDVTLVESVAFAWLARQNILAKTGNLPAVTGANSRVVLGQVCF